MENELVIKTIFKTREKKKEVLWAMEGNRTATSCSLNKLIQAYFDLISKRKISKWKKVNGRKERRNQQVQFT